MALKFIKNILRYTNNHYLIGYEPQNPGSTIIFPQELILFLELSKKQN